MLLDVRQNKFHEAANVKQSLCLKKESQIKEKFGTADQMDTAYEFMKQYVTGEAIYWRGFLKLLEEKLKIRTNKTFVCATKY